jgi:glycosyltransferase involved in cell wall biosynthesis
MSISVVIPAYNAAQLLDQCLKSLTAFCGASPEIIVVDDGSTDSSKEVIAGYPAVRTLSTGGRRGPAFARNLGARAATGEILFFLDSDVCVHSNTLQIVQAAFDANPGLDALIGSYDNEPGSPDFLSQYRNLMHTWTHQTGAREASTFWSGCGAIRRTLFLEHSGFSESYDRPAIEDIELGYRLVRAGRKIVLDHSLRVKHLKRWTFWGLVKTDIFDRGIPWTELILRDRRMPNDLNLQLSQRVSVALSFILVALSAFTAVLWRGYFLIPVLAIVLLLLARYWTEFSGPDRPPLVLVAILSAVGLTGILAYRLGMFGLIPPLMLSLTVLFVRHRYAGSTRGMKLIRWCAIVVGSASVLVAAFYLPNNRLTFCWIVVCAALALLNSQFYLFLAANRGVSFALAAIPFHLLYHFYNGISFIIGLLRHLFVSRSLRAESEYPRANPAAYL